MTDKIYSSINGTKKEVKGEKLESLLQAQVEVQEAQRLIEAETTAKAQAKESAMAKLRKLGLTDDEIAGLIS